MADPGEQGKLYEQIRFVTMRVIVEDVREPLQVVSQVGVQEASSPTTSKKGRGRIMITLCPLTTLVAVVMEKVTETAESTVERDLVMELTVRGPGERAGRSEVGGRRSLALTESNLELSLAFGSAVKRAMVPPLAPFVLNGFCSPFTLTVYC